MPTKITEALYSCPTCHGSKTVSPTIFGVVNLVEIFGVVKAVNADERWPCPTCNGNGILILRRREPVKTRG